MAKQYTVIVTSTQASDLRTHKVAQNSGDKGRALRIKAKAGETYQLVEMQVGQAHSYAPQNVKVKRVGNDLVITFEGGSRPDIVIEGYYDVMPKDHKGLIGEAEDGNLYEYIPEDPHPLGLVQMLPEGGQDVAMALGAGEIIAPAEAAIAAFPLLGLLGLGAAGAAAYVLNKDDKTTPTNGISGKLSDTSDLTDGGNKNDDITRDNTPTLTGTAPVGSTATVTINGQTYPVTVNPDGTWTFQQPTNLPDGTYYPILNVTQNGVTTKSNLTPFTIDTTPPSIAITSNAAALASGETATITFTLTEAVADFAQGDVAVTGGTLSNFQQDPNNPLVYTATFTPASTGTSATISVANDKFSDAAGNLNTDGAEANNIVSLATNATVTGALDPNATNTNGTPNDSGAKNDNHTNDNTPTLKGKVPAGSTAKIIINGVEQPVQVDANGNWTYTVPNGLPDGTYTPQLIVTPQGSSTPNAPVPLTPFTIDTVPPSIVVSAPTNSLVAGQTTPITFTLSEPVADFTAADIAVTGGTLSNFVQSPTDPKIYTATFTPSTTGTSASITVPSGKFSDAAANFNTDGADTAPTTTNTITLATNATASGGLAPVSDNSTGTPNDNTTNDATPELAGKVAPGSTVKVKIKNDQGVVVGEGTATVDANGNWTYTQPDNLPDGTYSPEVIVNGGTPTPLKPFVIDTVPPTVAITAPVTTLAAGASTVVTFTVSEGTTDLTLADIAVTGGTLGTLQQSAANSLVYTATYTSTSGGAGAVSIASNRFSDAAGNLNKDTNENPAATGATYEANNIVGFNTGVNPTPTPDTNHKTALTIAPVTGDNVITATESGATLTTITGKVSGKFAAGDTVTLTLNGKPYSANVAADGSYQVKVTTTDLTADSDKKIEGTVTGTGGTVATAAQTYTVESSDVVTKTALIIDPVTPDNVLSSNETGTIAITGKVTGKFAAGDTVTLSVNGKTFTGTVDAGGSYSIGVPATDLNADSDTQVDGQVTGTGGTTAVAIQNYALDGSNPTPTPPASLKTALSLNPVTGDNILSATEQGATTTTLSGKVTGTFVAGDVVTLKINGTPYTASVAADGSYSVSVQTSDLKADSDHKIDASVTGTNGSSATAAQSYVLEDNANVGKVTALTIDPVTADNIIGSAESAGSIAITGKVTGAFAVGDTVTLTVNGKTFSGTVAAGGAYSIPVPAADLLADADTTVDGKVTGTGGSAAVALQDYGVDPNINPTPAPSVRTALTINPITGDNIINSAESGATSTVVTGKVTGTFAAGDVVTLLVNNKTYTGSAAADGSYSISVPTADLVADADTKIEGSVTGGNGGQFASAAQDYVLDANSPSAPTKTALTIDTITADNMISDAENTGSINVTGTVTGKFAAGDKVTLTINGKSYTGVADAAGKFTIPVLASDLVADSDTQVDGTVTGTGGTLATALQNYGTNITNPAPAPTPSAKTAIAIDPVTGDNILNSADQGTATITVIGKVTGAFAAGDTVTLSLNGQSFTTTVAADGSFTKAIATSNFTADADTKIEGSVTGTGGSYATTAQDYTLDANAPTDPKQTALSIDPITQDNLIGVSETTGTINVTGHVTGKFAAGDVVSLVINGTTYTATAAADGSYSVAVPAYQLINDPDTQVDGTVTGTGGTTAAALQNYAVDPHVPVNPTPGPVPVPTLKTALTIDAVTTDNIINATDAAQATTTITGKVTGTYAAGDTVTLTINGKDYTTAVAANGSYTISTVATADLVNDADTKIEGSVTGTGGSYATAAQDYVVDTGSTPSKTALSINPVTADNIIGTGENTGSIAITGKVTGAFAIGDQVTLTVNGQTYRGTVLDSAGNYSIPVLASDLVADADSTIDGTVRGTGGTTAAALQNYGVDSNVNPTDTTPPTVAITSNQASLGVGQTATITFTFSEAVADFVWDPANLSATTNDIVVNGGTLGALTHVGINSSGQDIYTATFTPYANSTANGEIKIAAGKFTDMATPNANANVDTYDGATTPENLNNIVTLTVNTVSSTFTTVNDSKDATEDGSVVSDNVKTNDSQATSITKVNFAGGADSNITASTTSANGTTINSTYGVLKIGADGSYTYTIDNTKPAVQALAAGQKVSEVFTYTATDGSSTKTANLTINITGTNDAPVAFADTATALEAGGTANGSAGSNATGNVLTNDTDVDLADTKVVSAIHAGSATGTTGDSAVAAGTPTVKAGTYGSISINADGSYTYTITDQNNSAIQALRTSGQSVSDVFTYTVKDGSNATHQATITVNITGANDAPTLTTTISDKTATAGTALTSFSVASNFADVDTTANGETATYSAKLVDSTGNLVNGGNLPSWLQIDPATGTFSGTPPAGTAAGDIYIRATRTDAGGFSVSGDFKITLAAAADITPPTVAIVSNQASLSSGQTAVITFTFSEAVADFVWDPANPSATTNDIVVTGGTLSALTHVGVNAQGKDIYTATFTPTSGTTATATIGIHGNKFKDLAATPNWNVDDYDLTGGTNNNAENINNKVSINVDTTVASSLTLINDTATIGEAGGVSNGTAGTALSSTSGSLNVLNNDTAATSVTQIAVSGGSNSAVTSGSTSASNGTSITGQYGTLVMGANGSYTYVLDPANATVDSLQVGSSLTEVFTYTATDGTTSKTANLTVTINGTNDAPTVAIDLADQNGTVGTALTYVFDSGTFADVDTADTKTYTAQIVDSTGNTVISNVPSTASGGDWLAFNATTRTFTGTPPAAGTYAVRVTCTDSQGASTYDDFNIVVSDATTPSVKTALTINPVTGDNVILASENTGNITLTGKVSGTFAEGDTVTLVVDGTNYTGTAAADGSYSISVPAAKLAADTDKKVEGTVTGTGGQLATAAQSYVVETTDTPTKTTLMIDPITADNVVLSSEKDGSNNIAVTGKVGGVFVAGTDTVTLTINGVQYSNIAIANDGTFTVDVPFTGLQSDADTTVDGTVTGTGGSTATALQNYALVDESGPKIAITRSGVTGSTMTGQETITFTLTEASTDFAFGDVTVSGDGTLDSASWTAVSSTVYTAIFTPTANKVGSATIGVKAGTFSDASGNLNKDTYEPFIANTDQELDNIVSVSTNTDNTPPTVAVSQLTSPVTGPTTVTFTLSEASSDFTAVDVYVTPGAGSLDNWTKVSDTVYTARFNPTANSSGNVTIGVASGKFMDAAGNNNQDTYISGTGYEANNKTDFTYNTDTTPPTIAITGPSGTVSSPTTITFTLFEASSDFTRDDITVTGGGTLGALVQSASDPKVYTAIYTPPSGANADTGTATISVASDTFKDAAGNFNKDGGDLNNHLSVSFDTIPPTVAITTDNASGHVLATGDSTIVTFTFSEEVADFVWDHTNPSASTNDIVVAGGSLGQLTHVGLNAQGEDVYTATFTPTANFEGVGSIAIASSKFRDVAGNLNIDSYLADTSDVQNANNITTLAVDTKAPTQTVSFGSMTKDSTLATASSGDDNTNNWTTADTSAGRLVSGFMTGGPLAFGEELHIYRGSGANAVDLGVAKVNAAGTAWEFTDTNAYSANWTYSARVVDYAGNKGAEATRNVTVTTVAATAQDGNDSGAIVAYTGTSLNAKDGDDTITVTSTIQSDLAAGGFISGGAGIDTIKIEAGTMGSPITLNLETLTTNQTVKNIQEVEIFELQGYTTMQMSANDVLSLGGANATTMAPFSFASTSLGNGTLGGTNSTGKVQMVIKGTADDLLKLDVLASDGTSSAGVAGNSGLSGTWSYKGDVQIGLNTYKVYDHSATGAQVLVDLPVVVNTISPIAIISIDNGTTSLDSGTAGDFITNDNTLAYSGSIPVEFDDAQHDVWVEIVKSDGTILRAGTATIDSANHTWSWDTTNTTNFAALNDGTYTIRSTIVANGYTGATSGSTLATPHADFGSLGVDTHSLVIDTTTPTVVVARAGSATLSAGQSETITFTFSEAVSDFMWDEATQTGDIIIGQINGQAGGRLINFSGSGTTYTATFVPSIVGTTTIGVADHVAMDAAGNENLDTNAASPASPLVNDGNNSVSIAYQAAPTQTVAFSSMTKDSSLTGANADWFTADGSAGRLVSGTIDAPLQTGQNVAVYANGVLVGNATVVGQAWEITDLNAYNANWTYTAKVVDSSNNAGPVSTQIVTVDFTEAPPTITSVTDSANSSIANSGTTANMLSTVSGIGNAGSTVYLFDNTGTNLVGSTIVASNGTWTITGLSTNGAVGYGSNTFSAMQVDAVGNTSVLSNLWTVSSTGGNTYINPNMEAGATGFTSTLTLGSNANWDGGTNNYAVYALTPTTTAATTLTSNNNAYTGGTWSKTYVAAFRNPDGALAGKTLVANVYTAGTSTVWATTADVVAGQTYTFKFDYAFGSYNATNTTAMVVMIDGQTINLVSTGNESGHFTATYTATSTKSVDLAINGVRATAGTGGGDFDLDNFVFAVSPPPTNTLVAGGTLLASDSDNASLVYQDGIMNAMAGNDTITASSTQLQTALEEGGFIDGGAGVDKLKLLAGTTLDLTAITSNQTVKPIQEVEVLQMQGSSTLTMSANDVLSLGGSNASTMSTYSFASTAGGVASTSSTGKVQMVVLGTTSDALNLNGLATDGVTSNGIEGNTGLFGEWQYMGETVISGTTYKVYNHSKTQAQVLTNMTASTESAVVSFSSMTKDSSLAMAQADWLTADGSAGRLVTGTLAEDLGSNTLKVYANGVQVNSSLVSISADGKSWAFTDLNAYTGNWTYRADVVNSSNVVIGSATQVVTTDFTEAAPVITSVTDSTDASIANAGTTTNTLSTVSGTGNAGDTLYLYDNTGTNLVGITTVAADGTWSISGLATNTAVGTGSNTFSARQVDALGNSSVLSNLWTVSSLGGGDTIINGDFSSGNTGFTTTNVNYTTAMNHGSTANQYALTTNVPPGVATLGTVRTLQTTTDTNLNWTTSYNATSNYTTQQGNPTFYSGNPNGKMGGTVLEVNLGTGGTFWQETMNVVAGKTYTFEFDYQMNSFGTTAPRLTFDGTAISFTTNGYETGHFKAIYTATTTKQVTLSLYADNSATGVNNGDIKLDNFSFTPNTVAADGSLTDGGTLPFTSGIDGVSGTNNGSVLTYTGGVSDMLDGNDVLNIGTNAQTLLGTAGNYIDGSAGVDTLKLATGTVLDLNALTLNQTVKAIEQVEVVQMQGNSMLALSANDVLSLGGANATTMSTYTFGSTTQTAGATGSTSSTNKVQFVVQGSSTDSLVLSNLQLDGVTTNNIVGNTGLAGRWDYKGTVALTGVDGLSHTYKVYDQSTTQAQLLVDDAMNVFVDENPNITTTVAFSSMTKDSSLTSANADWLTSDASAGRQVSGTLSADLAQDEELKIYANGVAVGTAEVVDQAWTFTDVNGYNANWVYTAQVVSTSTQKGGAITTQVVTLDNTQSAPTITSVIDSTEATIANAGTTASSINTVSGTGTAGETIYLYDNTGTNLVGTTLVASNGTWSITGLSTHPRVGAGSNTFAVRQVDAQGNMSDLSNLVTVIAGQGGGSDLLVNGDFSAGNTGFTNDLTFKTNGASIPSITDGYGVVAGSALGGAGLSSYIYNGGFGVGTLGPSITNTTSASASYGAGVGTWTKTFINSTQTNYSGVANKNPDGTMTGNVLAGQIDTVGVKALWSENVSVVAGQTYVFKFDYIQFDLTGQDMGVYIDGNFIQMVTANEYEAGHFTATYTAATSKTMTLSVTGAAGGTSNYHNEFVLDNFSFKSSAPVADGSLTSAGNLGATSANNTLSYQGGALDALAGNDTITVAQANLQATLGASGVISGGAGVDTLVLATGTALDLTTLTGNQTVKPVEQVEVFTMQGGSALTLSANDVLSLGGSNASTMSAYAFSTSSGGTASTSSNNKVQMVVHGTSSDFLLLDLFKADDVTTNGVEGNTGLAGQWNYMGTTTANGATYAVYNHSTTGAQVLVDSVVKVVPVDPATVTNTVTFSTMTKDSSLSAASSDWLTSDASAGRLVSGTLASALGANDVVKVYANGVLVGQAEVNGTAWAITDTNGYNANWTYTAQVVNSAGVSGKATVQQVTLDNTEAPPVIIGVVDSAGAKVANNGTTTKSITTINGTGLAGDTIYVYDNTGTNMVAQATVDANGNWSATVTTGLTFKGSNTFSARQVDALGNESVLSNLWTVTAASPNLITNGDFSQGDTGFTTTTTKVNGGPINDSVADQYNVYSIDPYWNLVNGVTTGAARAPVTVDSADTVSGFTYVLKGGNGSGGGYIPSPDGAFTGNIMWGQVATGTNKVIWGNTINVVAGQSYTFTFDIGWNYMSTGYPLLKMGTAEIPLNATGTTGYYAEHVTVTFVAAATGAIPIELISNHTGSNLGDYWLDNFSLQPTAVAGDNTLAAGAAAPFSPNADGTSTSLTYTGGVADMLAGDDVLNIGTNAQTLLGTAGNLINGSTGIDTLKLDAGTTLNLVTLTNNQTVKSIQQVEVFELQGNSSLTLSANDVLSLGMANAFTSNGKVQFMVNGTGSDSVSLQNLLSDGVGGNTGLAGMWASAGTASYGGNTYNLYNHDTTGAQVWIKNTLTSVSLSASPLMLDLNGDGVQTTTLADGVLFDLLATGSTQATAWVNRHDGLLAIDLNGDGVVNSGAELLGSSTRLADGSLARDGWQALAQFDANGDGQIDLSDAVFNQLRVWVDADTDGTTDAGELRTLADAGIQSISLNHDATQTAQNGNILDGMATVQHTDGSTTQMTDAWLNVQQPAVLNLDAVIAAGDRSDGVADMTDGTAQILQLNVSDVLVGAASGRDDGLHILQVHGDAADVVQLSQLFADGHTEGQWAANGQVTQNGQTFNVYQYSGDASLQVLIDQHIAQSNVHLS